jgi:hypothetical protein
MQPSSRTASRASRTVCRTDLSPRRKGAKRFALTKARSAPSPAATRAGLPQTGCAASSGTAVRIRLPSGRAAHCAKSGDTARRRHPYRSRASSTATRRPTRSTPGTGRVIDRRQLCFKLRYLPAHPVETRPSRVLALQREHLASVLVGGYPTRSGNWKSRNSGIGKCFRLSVRSGTSPLKATAAMVTSV